MKRVSCVRPSHHPSSHPAAARRAGFTLVEILIVVSIIAILASLSLVSVRAIQRKAKAAAAVNEISGLGTAIERYQTDEKMFPGIEERDIDERTNQFPVLFNALFGERKPKGPGGRSAPYGSLEGDRIVVANEDWNEDTGEPSDRWRKARQSEIENPKIDKYYLDPFNRAVYVYRCNKGRKAKSWMKNSRGYDLYSLGPDGEDQTTLGEDERELGDDLTN